LNNSTPANTVRIHAGGDTFFNGGNVGIGTTNPSYKLHVAGTAFATNLTLSGWSSGDALKLNYGNATGTVEAVSFLANGGTNGNIKMVMASANSGDLILNGANNTNQLTLYRDGNVGIGTSDPKEKLHVSTGNDLNSGNITFLIGGTEGTNARTGRIIKNTSSPYEMTIRATDFSGTGDLILNDDGGNVGIGTSSPTSPASVGKFLHIADAGSAGIVLEDTNAGDWEMYNASNVLYFENRGKEMYNASNVLYFENRGNSALALALDVNSRISLSNNDSGAHNTIFGYQAGNSIASGGNYNMALGNSALYTEDTGTHSTAIGYASLYSQDVGSGISGNTALGLETGKFNVTGTLNTWVGYQAGLGASGQSNSQNTGVGYRAGYSITTGIDNTVVGTFAGDAVTSQSNLTLVGKNAGGAINDNGADGTVAVGSGSLGQLTSGSDNLAVGMNAMFKVNIGHDNVAVGKNAGFYATTAGFSTFIGKESGQGINATKLTGDHNSAIGYRSGYLLQGSAGSNTLVGSLSGDNITDGIENTIIGYGARPSSASAQNQIVIGRASTK
jgi:hypothetical protein